MGYLIMEFDFGPDARTLFEKVNDELERIPQQLAPGYVFSSEKNLEPERRQPASEYLGQDGHPTFQSVNSQTSIVCDFAKTLRVRHGAFKNVIVIGNGGSISSLAAIHKFLIEYSHPQEYVGESVRLHIVDSQEPAPIRKIMSQCSKDDSIVVAVSKSGNTQGLIDSLGIFKNAGYLLCAITNPVAGRLSQIMQSHLKGAGLKPSDYMMQHPPVGGRYTGRTCVATLPLALMGVGKKVLEGMESGCQEMYSRTQFTAPQKDNPALMLACTLYYHEKYGGIDIIYSPMYSHRLSGFAHLATQLVHESSCKNGAGQTLLAALAPECQHHTNQRFFGGKKNIAGVFFTVDEKSELKTSDGVFMHDALRFEYEGTRDDAKNQSIPSACIMLGEPTPPECGRLMAFMHYGLGVYPSLLRDVNPFDQPQVEQSKRISRELREKHLNESL
jgi:glucose-6-phosphate isomerase